MISTCLGPAVSVMAMKISPVLPFMLTNSNSALEGSFLALLKEVMGGKRSIDVGATHSGFSSKMKEMNESR